MPEKRSAIKSFFKYIWHAIDAARRGFVNLLFLALAIALLFILFHDDSPDVADSTALVIAPKGKLVEQLSGQSLQRMINEARGTAPAETLLKDVVDAIAAGKEDERVKALVFDLSSFEGARMTKLQDVRDAIIDFKAQDGRGYAAGIRPLQDVLQGRH